MKKSVLVRPYNWFRSLMKKTRYYRRVFLISGTFLFLLWFAQCIPGILFKDSTSTVLIDRNGQLLGARIADDEQWRFEDSDSIPLKFKICLIQFEDREFYYHHGVSIKGLGRAIVQNFTSGKRVSGGSTLTMQLIRLIRKNPSRTYFEKILEIFRATRLEMSYSKEDILKLYASHAPFGSNVVGLEAASWRYYGRPPHQLSWSESATLAVLPNAPGLIYPGRNHDQLKAKRDRLLKRLHEIGLIDDMTYDISLLEPLPGEPLPLPNQASHLLAKLIKNGQKGKTIKVNLDQSVQRKVARLLDDHLAILKENKIYNGAIIVTSVETGEVLAYVGNSLEAGPANANRVNCIDARRSTGSILKPFLYMKALDDGVITPNMLLMDAPSRFGSFSPKNFAGNYDGLVPANQALSRSLNIPLVHLLNKYGMSRFHNDLRELGFTTIDKPAGHYGLSLILGGAEVTLADLSNAYTQMAQRLKGTNVRKISYLGKGETNSDEHFISRGAIWSAFNAMLEVRRPNEEGIWQLFSSSRKIAWKTGTSFGFRDAWAVGVTPDYVVSVWIGNADGEGRPGLTGLQAAAPLLFQVFDQLPMKTSWFAKPFTELKKVDICQESGHRATRFCEHVMKSEIPANALKAQGCPYHRVIHLDQSGKYRVDSECASTSEMSHKNWFVIPSHVERYYRRNHPEFKELPRFSEFCNSGSLDKSFTIHYPKWNQKIYLPVDLKEERRKVIFEAISRSTGSTLFWHLDEVYVGQTSEIHQLEFMPEPGKHTLTIIDENGYSKKVKFEVL